MKLLRAILAALLLTTLSQPIYAETLYLHIRDNSGKWVIYTLDQVDKITYSNGTVSFCDRQGNKIAGYSGNEIALMEIKEDTTPSGIEATPVADNKELFTVTNGNISCKEDGVFRIYDAEGRQIVTITEYKSGQEVDLGYLTSGIYFAVINNQAIKIKL